MRRRIQSAWRRHRGRRRSKTGQPAVSLYWLVTATMLHHRVASKAPAATTGAPAASAAGRPSGLPRGLPLVTRQRLVVPPDRHIPPEVTDGRLLGAVQGSPAGRVSPRCLPAQRLPAGQPSSPWLAIALLLLSRCRLPGRRQPRGPAAPARAAAPPAGRREGDAERGGQASSGFSRVWNAKAVGVIAASTGMHAVWQECWGGLPLFNCRCVLAVCLLVQGAAGGLCLPGLAHGHQYPF